LRLRYKLWLEHEELGKAFGDGPLEMLERVERSGSLRQAAAEMGMSYNKAWYLVRRLEKALGFPLLERRAGGWCGGGSVVTPRARELVNRYRRFREEAVRQLEEVYGRHFTDFRWGEPAETDR
jgi:molybdate transport system regulatory protein